LLLSLEVCVKVSHIEEMLKSGDVTNRERVAWKRSDESETRKMENRWFGSQDFVVARRPSL